MKIISFFILILSLIVYAENPQPVAHDSLGLIVVMKERYDQVRVDTCIAVTIINGEIWLSHREKPTTIFPLSGWAMVAIERLKESKK